MSGSAAEKIFDVGGVDAFLIKAEPSARADVEAQLQRFTAEKGLIRVKVYNADGSLRGVVAGPDQLVEGGAGRVFESVADAQSSGFDVAVDTQQRVLVLDTIQNAVRVFARSKAK